MTRITHVKPTEPETRKYINDPNVEALYHDEIGKVGIFVSKPLYGDKDELSISLHVHDDLKINNKLYSKVTASQRIYKAPVPGEPTYRYPGQHFWIRAQTELTEKAHFALLEIMEELVQTYFQDHSYDMVVEQLTIEDHERSIEKLGHKIKEIERQIIDHRCQILKHKARLDKLRKGEEVAA